MRAIAAMYENGKGLQGGKDDQQAFKWYMDAASHRDHNADIDVGRFYELGKGGIKVDYATALSWYEKAAFGICMKVDLLIKWIMTRHWSFIKRLQNWGIQKVCLIGFANYCCCC